MKGETAVMQLYLLRHGIAEEGAPGRSDEVRALTSEGRGKLRQVLQAAAKAGVDPGLILTSPLKRAVQTAQIAQRILKYKGELIRTPALVPSSTVERVWEEVRPHRDLAAILLVGHNPLFSELAPYLLDSRNLQFDFKKGALLRVDVENLSAHPQGVLRWHLTAKLAGDRD